MLLILSIVFGFPMSLVSALIFILSSACFRFALLSSHWFSKIIDFKSCFFSSICIWCYLFPSKHSFCHIPQVLVLYFYFHLIENISNLSWDFLFDSCVILKCFFFISKYFEIFQLSFCYCFLVNPTVVWEHTLYDFFSSKFVQAYCMFQNVVDHSGCSMWTWK